MFDWDGYAWGASDTSILLVNILSLLGVLTNDFLRFFWWQDKRLIHFSILLVIRFVVQYVRLNYPFQFSM